ncbi:TVP38/TMEM64 family protein [Ureibacillus acetophenoni]|uniref:TVP38/TMEM64 family membrane protein n=1 Tax=Ureibacillus acetophenoni TaxID=614649 RepID=A0A285U0V6_9BACL|nr:TVP38/TMEM64 family protein [Ureibacillus acetophenoni]SOC35038.1 uncharacterized membrane protein YdjX (TVP38/TMEM64 family) [Ureibacillus acetophenoni]
MSEWFTEENIQSLVSHYRTLGPLIGILLPFLEALLPFLPLVVIVVANVSSYGLWLGFILSWAGTVLGSYVVFLIVRKFGRNPRFKRFIERENVQKLIKFVTMRGLSPLFILLCFPFTPSVLVNIVAGLSYIKKKYYLFVLMAGKFIMVLSISVLGYDIASYFTNPIKLIFVAIGIVVLWVVSKTVEKRLNKRVDKDLREASSKSEG